jgi:hypothetical protein
MDNSMWVPRDRPWWPTLTAGSAAISIANGAGSITIDANINVALSMPSIFNVAGSPVLNSGTFTGKFRKWARLRRAHLRVFVSPR